MAARPPLTPPPADSRAGCWGDAWRENLDRFGAPARLSRGRDHLRSGSVIHFEIRGNAVRALVSAAGAVYGVELRIARLSSPARAALREQCAGRSWFRGELVHRPPQEFREIAAGAGLFPSPGEVSFRCACLDRRRGVCEHAAAALYGIGARVDAAPEEFFALRGVDLRGVGMEEVEGIPSVAAGETLELGDDELSDLFGVEIEAEPEPTAAPRPAKTVPPKPRPRPPRTLWG